MIYAIGTVQVELEVSYIVVRSQCTLTPKMQSASLFIVLFMIFPLALTLTAFLMWTIISLNGMCSGVGSILSLPQGQERLHTWLRESNDTSCKCSSDCTGSCCFPSLPLPRFSSSLRSVYPTGWKKVRSIPEGMVGC